MVFVYTVAHIGVLLDAMGFSESRTHRVGGLRWIYQSVYQSVPVRMVGGNRPFRTFPDRSPTRLVGWRRGPRVSSCPPEDCSRRARR